MMKLFCDVCKKELDSENMKYVGVSMYDYEDNEGADGGNKHWDFCHECASVVKNNIAKLTGVTVNEKEKAQAEA